MQRDVIEQVVTLVAETLDLDPDGVAPDASAQSIKQWTSLAHLRVMAAVEESFGVEFTTDEMIAMTGIPEIAAAIIARSGSPAA